MTNNKDKVKELCSSNGWDFTKFEKYFNIISEKNKVMNLTGFKDDSLWGDGILESLLFMIQILPADKEEIKILDIGAGVGFPSIPLALLKLPNVKITIYEPLGKRIMFLREVVELLNLQENVTLVKTRSEDIREKNIFDLVVARAVSDINSMLLSSFHLVKVRGEMCLIKGAKVDLEIEEAQRTLHVLKTVAVKEKLKTDSEEKSNWIVKIWKKRSTPPAFPYKWKDIIKLKSIKP